MIYESICPTCGTEHEYIRSVAERNDTPVCCGAKTIKIIATAPSVGAMSWGIEKSFHMPDGKHGGQGTLITSGSEYKEYMKKNNLVSADEGAQEANIQKKRRAKEEKRRRKQAVIDAVKKHTS